jgi:hypothetical protein
MRSPAAVAHTIMVSDLIEAGAITPRAAFARVLEGPGFPMAPRGVGTEFRGSEQRRFSRTFLYQRGYRESMTLEAASERFQEQGLAELALEYALLQSNYFPLQIVRSWPEQNLQPVIAVPQFTGSVVYRTSEIGGSSWEQRFILNQYEQNDMRLIRAWLGSRVQNQLFPNLIEAREVIGGLVRERILEFFRLRGLRVDPKTGRLYNEAPIRNVEGEQVSPVQLELPFR